MDFYSTRDSARKLVSLDFALNAGLAPDGGLYVPASIPKNPLIAELLSLSSEELEQLSLASVAERALRPFFQGSMLAQSLSEICDESLNLPMPQVPLAHSDSEVLELFHGPTAAFKDFAARFLAACLLRLNTQALDHTVLVATSGDTGGAVAAAFHQKPGFRVVILYPDGRVSPRQAHQLGAFGGNVSAYKVAGSFDDCQAMVKRAFSNPDLRGRCRLISANSISLGRLLPQMAYYVDASLRWRAKHSCNVNLIIPTGNLGHGLGAILARAMGAPIDSIALISNANQVLSHYLQTGNYTPAPSVATLANAMDVGAPSNFERLAHLFPQLENVYGESVSDTDIQAMLVRAPQHYEQVVCPHTACGLVALEHLKRRHPERRYLVAATAHAAKFDEVVEPLIGQRIEVPPALQALLDQPTHAQPLEVNDDALAALL